ncbi:MAG: hypothetical protein LOD88_04845 [Novibacillus thermophilus]|jgi:hypothetical protein|uniref:Uncharacterized protein n=1 Tax=Novibacillus thermophilus TaxID=1471761 RepID=A0A1U9K404_9BACL|nr:hypothetical protein [Novibacillus thermophilus]AQS54754.1 hypothetical protein B0W44_02175 [Novibacillus thermophilus]
MSFEYIRHHFYVPARQNMKVLVEGKMGVIKDAIGPYIMVLFEGEQELTPCHPRLHVDYLEG